MDLSFGSDFGQKVDLCVRIREILRNYPLGTSVFKELLQNADDANASEVRLCLDTRSHPTARLHPGMAAFQGPSLLAYNDAVFTPRDFASIQRIGDSLKREESKGTKTGRFGIGFNSVFHLTDLPSFASGGSLVFLDPQACHLPGVNPGDPGKRVEWAGAHAALVAAFPDQFSPYHVWGCAPLAGSPFPGTLFRLPLRTPAAAAAGRLSTTAHSVANVRALLRALAREAHETLLFLKHVQAISVWEWLPGEAAPVCMAATAVRAGAGADAAQLRALRGFVMSAPAAATGGGGGSAGSSAAAAAAAAAAATAVIHKDFLLTLETSVACLGPTPGTFFSASAAADGATRDAIPPPLAPALFEAWGIPCDSSASQLALQPRAPSAGAASDSTLPPPLLARQSSWLIANQLGGGTTGIMAERPDLAHLRLIPWAGCAACLHDSTSRTPHTLLPRLRGAAYTFLPLPISTGLPLHVNGFFDLSSNRRDIWWEGSDMAGEGAARAAWNKALLTDVVAACYARLVRVLGEGMGVAARAAAGGAGAAAGAGAASVQVHGLGAFFTRAAAQSLFPTPRQKALHKLLPLLPPPPQPTPHTALVLAPTAAASPPPPLALAFSATWGRLSGGTPWCLLSTAIYAALHREPVLWVRSISAAARDAGLELQQASAASLMGKWVAPREALLLMEGEEGVRGGGEAEGGGQWRVRRRRRRRRGSLVQHLLLQAAALLPVLTVHPSAPFQGAVTPPTPPQRP